MKKLIGISCGKKIFISEFTKDNYRKYTNVVGLIINGETPSETFNKNWCVIDREPETVQKRVKQSNINYRYELIDKSMKSKKLPLVMKREDVATYKKDDCVWRWNPEHEIYKSLYKLVSDEQPDTLEDVEYEYETVMEVNEIREYKGFAYDVQRTQWKHEGTTKLTEKDLHHQLIDELVFPDIVLPARPCKLTPSQTYKIVRQYVKQHINYDFASITSDYNFCFTVKKKIPLSEPEKYTVDVNFSLLSKRKKKPKYEIRYRRFREIECFEMAPKPYQSYTIIKGFRGENQEDLKHKIDDYCKRLVNFINEPVTDCPHCKGRGVIDFETGNQGHN